MISSAPRADDVLDSEHPLIPDRPIEASIPYRSRVRGASRHFGFFPFFAKKPWPVVQEYIKHYTQPGELVGDPFAGSGVTPVEALVLGRRAVAGDINPVARFNTRMTAIAPVNLEALHEAFNWVRRDVQVQIETLDQLTDGQILELLLTLDYPRNSIPTTVRRKGLATIDQMHTPRQLAGLSLLRSAIDRIQDPIPCDLLRVALANTVRYCNVTYALPDDNKGQRRSPYRGDAGFLRRFSYSPATPERFYELPVWTTFVRCFGRVNGVKSETNHLINGRFTPDSFMLFDVPAARFHEETGESSIDYIFTDPPYSNDIHFLDLSTLWAAWLRLEITDEARDDELLLRSTQQNPRDQFARKFAAVAESIARSLKRDRWLTLVYKHSDLSLWQTVVSSCEDSGLHFVNAVWQDINIRSTRQIESPNINPEGDMYLNFRKMTAKRFASFYAQREPLLLPTRTNYVEHEIERLIVTYLGADIALLTAGVLQQVLNSRSFKDGAENLEGLRDDIGSVVSGSSRFAVWQQDGGKPLWVMASNSILDPSLEAIDRHRYVVFEYLREHGEATEGRLKRHLLTRLAETHDHNGATSDVVALLRNVGTEISPNRWRFDGSKVLGFKQLRFLFRPSQADYLRHRIEQRQSQATDRLRPDLESIALLGDRLRKANTDNPTFEGQYLRLLEVLQAILRRLETEFGEQIERVMAIGDWARHGIDLRNLPFDDIVLLVVMRGSDLPFELYLQIAERVFTDLRDNDVLAQFQVGTVTDWEHAGAGTQGLPDAFGIPLLVRS